MASDTGLQPTGSSLSAEEVGIGSTPGGAPRTILSVGQIYLLDNPLLKAAA